ncbi:LacI family DNA-binding transcriptional regulator [Streptomyces sp. L2]|uniref:LacI family DNA-binding transcriptional regulator n=1 Tax=Streptomyces sp. L2 TaxID=2162665 RepID=UPI001F51497F|nr:LacI family DNA-binding transcriptional regulator [Streptomyces sp. L2]
MAEATGLSVTTVSHALRGKGQIAPATRDRVRRAAEELGYRPDPVARGLVSGRTGILGQPTSGVSRARRSARRADQDRRVLALRPAL